MKNVRWRVWIAIGAAFSAGAAWSAGCGGDDSSSGGGGRDASSDAPGSSLEAGTIDGSIGVTDGSSITDASASDANDADIDAGPCATASGCVLASAQVSWLDADEVGAYFMGTLGDAGAGGTHVFKAAFAGGAPFPIAPGFDEFQIGTTAKSIVMINPDEKIAAYAKSGAEVDGGRLFGDNPGLNTTIAGHAALIGLVSPGAAWRVIDENDAATTDLTPAPGVFRPMLDTSRMVALGFGNALTYAPLPPADAAAFPKAVPEPFAPAACALAGNRIACSTGSAIVTLLLDALDSAATTVYAGVTGASRGIAADAKSIVWWDQNLQAIVSCPTAAPCTMPKVIAAVTDPSTLFALTSNSVVYWDPTLALIRAVAR